MMPYILVFMVCIFLTSISSRKKIIPLLLSCLILSLFAGFRDKNIGSDTDFYPHWYISEIRYIHNLIDLITIETERNLDKGYLFLYWIASWIGNQYWIGLFLTELVISVFTFLGFIRLSRYFKGGIAIFTMAFLLLVFNYTLNAMRQECAISICFFAFSYLWEKKWIPYLCWTFVACTFHSSAIITLALPFLMMISYISNDKKRNLLISFLFLMMCTVTMAFWTLLDMIGDLGLFNEAYTMRYGEGGAFEGVERLPYAPLLLCLVFYLIMYNSYRKKIMDKNIFLFQFLITTIYLLCLTFQLLIVFLYRIGLYFYILSIYFFSIELSSKKTNPVLKIGCILYLMAYWIFLYVVKNTSETYPYTSKILGID